MFRSLLRRGCENFFPSRGSNKNEETATKECLQGIQGEVTMNPESRNLSFISTWLCNWKFMTFILVYFAMLGVTIWLCMRKQTCNQSLVTQWFIISCPKGWVGYEGKCYYFSELEGTWDFSKMECDSSGASLVSINTQQDMDFVMRYKNSAKYWVGLRRLEEGQPWKWTDGSIFSNWFPIRGNDFCAYLDDTGVSSTRCDQHRNWICTISLQSCCREKLRGLPIISTSDNCTVVTYELQAI